MGYAKMSVKDVESWSGISRSDVPKYLIVDCAWPWSRSIDDAKRYIRNPKPHPRWTFPYFGQHPDMPKVRVGYSVVFSPSMATQLYFFLKLGVKYVFQIGSIGGLQKDTQVYDLIIPKECYKFDGISKEFHPSKTVGCDGKLLQVVESSLADLGFSNCHVGRTVSVASNWIQTRGRMRKWIRSGLLGIDQETAMVYSLSKALGNKAVAILRVTDTQSRGEGQKDRPNIKNKTLDRALKETVRNAVLLSISKLERL
jgi:uridine phosphorylase